MSSDNAALALKEAEESVAFSLLTEFLRTKSLSYDDAEFLKQRYLKQYEIFIAVRAHDQELSKKCKVSVNEILSEKIILEKARIEEAEESNKLRKMEDNRNSLQKELEFTEQREIVAKFELNELKKVHEELTIALDDLHRENNDLVAPVLTKLQLDITSLNKEIEEIDIAYDKESKQKEKILATVDALEKVALDTETTIAKTKENLEIVSAEPYRISRQIDAIQKAIVTIEEEIRVCNRRHRAFDQDQEKKKQQKLESEKLHQSLLEKIELNRQSIEQRERDVDIVRSNLEATKARNHDLTMSRVEVNVQRKESESLVRHNIDQLGICKKDYDYIKRQLRKKIVIVNSIKQVIPTLEDQLKDEESMLVTYKDDRDKKVKELSKIKEEKDVLLAHFLQQEGIESGKKEELEKVLSEVDDLEATVVTKMSELKRQSKLLQVLSAQRDILARETARVVQNEKNARQHVRLKELSVLDLTKRCNEISNRVKEFSALYDVIKNERNKYVNLIQISMQALAEMREKIRILNNEVEILGNESKAKDIALAKEKTANNQACSQRDILRQDMNRLLSEYRTKQGHVEQQMQEIGKLNIVINALEKQMIDIKNTYERAVEERNMIGVQLIDRNDEMCILYERSNQQQEAKKQGELVLMKLEEELRTVKLQTEELKRQYTAARKRLPEIDIKRDRIEVLEKLVLDERKKIDELSLKLEDPQNLDRWRPLEGEDPDIEQLNAKIKVLEDRLDSKREQILEKELIYEEVSSLTDRLRNQAVAKRDNAKYLADELNDLQCRIRDITKKMLASVSELSMYQASALRLQQEKSTREKLLEEARWRFDHGQAPNDEAVKDWNRKERKKFIQQENAMARQDALQSNLNINMVRTAAEPRPTAYIPDELGLAKPYGNLAPFKPSEVGSTMRHIRNPIPKPIEI